jgi:hypothetical protein
LNLGYLIQLFLLYLLSFFLSKILSLPFFFSHLNEWYLKNLLWLYVCCRHSSL